MSQQAPLLELPPELRNSIYRYALCTTEAIHVPLHDDKKCRKVPALLAVCQRIREEARSIPYGENTFHLGIPRYRDSDPALFKWFLRLGTTQCSLVTSLCVEYIPSRRDATVAPSPHQVVIDTIRRLLSEVAHEHVKALVLAEVSSEALNFSAPQTMRSEADLKRIAYRDGGVGAVADVTGGQRL